MSIAPYSFAPLRVKAVGTCSRRLVLCAVLGLGLSSSQVIAQTDDTPPFLPAACDLPGVTPDIAPRLQCGTVAVPRGVGPQDGGVFRLAIVIIKAAVAPKQGDPVVYVSGGPGAPLTNRAALIAKHEASVVAPGRDLILVDQRGSGRSEPALCTGLARQQLAIFAAGSEQPDMVRAWRQTYGSCRMQMTVDGLRPEWFGTQVTAADFEAVRRSLGVDRWSIYALSYGTGVAMTMMALHPESLRAVVLDSVYPPDPLPVTLPQSFGDALDGLFAACEASTACGAAHPTLRTTFQQAVHGLDARGLPVPLRPGLGMETFMLRAETFRLLVNVAMYSRRGLAVLPSFIENTRDRKAAALEGLISSVVQSYRGMSQGIMAAVGCRDRVSWQDATSSDAGDPPVSAFVAGMCNDWSQPGPPPLMARNTAIPTLLLAGQIDPITPPAFAHLAAAALGEKAAVIEFANVGHAVQQASPCGEAVVTAFIRDPAGTIDGACAAQIPPIAFQ